ncbi:CTP synthase|nr:CTP synthase [Candidatus Pantoea persica]
MCGAGRMPTIRKPIAKDVYGDRVAELLAGGAARRGKLCPRPRIAEAYGAQSSDEGYHCNFGVNPAFSEALEGKNLRIISWDAAWS